MSHWATRLLLIKYVGSRIRRAAVTRAADKSWNYQWTGQARRRGTRHAPDLLTGTGAIVTLARSSYATTTPFEGCCRPSRCRIVSGVGRQRGSCRRAVKGKGRLCTGVGAQGVPFDGGSCLTFEKDRISYCTLLFHPLRVLRRSYDRKLEFMLK